MQADNPFKEIIDKFQSTGKVDTVFGNPIVSKEKTLVPVSKVKYGFGGGWGKSPWIKSRGGDEQVDVEGQGIGFGGGGGIQVEPIGMVEITAESTHFMPINPQKKLIKTFVGGIIAGIILRKIFK